MKQHLIGTYYAGMREITLYTREGTGAEFYLVPEKACVPRIKVGINGRDWEQTLSWLMHELYELLLTVRGARYTDSITPANDGHDGYLFIFSHPCFSAVCAEAAEFLSKALPDLASHYNASVKAAKKQTKKK